jgi:CheY-like chemotaxis protein
MAARQREPDLEEAPTSADLSSLVERRSSGANEQTRHQCLPELSGLKVLVVEDEADARALILAVLERCGAEVSSASSVQEALVALERSLPDILVSDIGMPHEDGYCLLEKVRALPPERGGRIPAVALTAYARAEDRIKVLGSGFQMHVTKPVEPAELVAVVASLAGRTSSVNTNLTTDA